MSDESVLGHAADQPQEVLQVVADRALAGSLTEALQLLYVSPERARNTSWKSAYLSAKCR